jgi:branched-chain amino acid transport system substrate-binding protein
VVAVIAVVATLLVGACAGPAPASQGTAPSASSGSGAEGSPSQASSGPVSDLKPFKIGLVANLTGQASVWGQPTVNAAKQALADLNAAGGVFGQPVELVVGDNGTLPEQAVSEAKRLVSVEGAQVLIDGGGSGLCLADKVSVAVPNHVMIIGQTCISPAHTADQSEGAGYFFRARGPIAGLFGPIAKVMAADGVTNVCFPYALDAFGQSSLTSFTDAFIKLVPSAVVDAVALPDSPATSYLAEAQKCTALGRDTVATGARNEGQLDVFAKDAIEHGLVKHWYMGEDQETPSLFETVGWDALDGSKGFSGSGLPGPDFEFFRTNYATLYGGPAAVPLMEMTYDSVIIAALAAAKANSNDTQAIRDAMMDVANAPGEQIHSGVDAIKNALELAGSGKDVDYVGVSGGWEFGPNGEQQLTGSRMWHVDAATKSLPTDGFVLYDQASGTYTWTAAPDCKFCAPF